MQLPRMTTRRWKVAVALLGIMLGGAEFLRRRRTFAVNIASRHYWTYLAMKRTLEWGRLYDPHFEYGEYHRRMAVKWEVAADRPWFPLKPDSPEPPEPK